MIVCFRSRQNRFQKMEDEFALVPGWLSKGYWVVTKAADLQNLEVFKWWTGYRKTTVFSSHRCYYIRSVSKPSSTMASTMKPWSLADMLDSLISGAKKASNLLAADDASAAFAPYFPSHKSAKSS